MNVDGYKGAFGTRSTPRILLQSLARSIITYQAAYTALHIRVLENCFHATSTIDFSKGPFCSILQIGKSLTETVL